MTALVRGGCRLALLIVVVLGITAAMTPTANATTMMTEDMGVFGDNPNSFLATQGYAAADYLGARMIRYHRGLNPSEPDHFNMYFQRVDAWLARVEAQHMTPYLTITYQPGYPANLHPGVTDFGNWCEAIATRYGSRIRHYAVWNEPNNNVGGQFLENDESYYNQLYRSCYSEIKAVSAANKVYYGEIDAHRAGACAWVEDAVNNGGTTYADGIALHTYQWTLAPEQQLGNACQGIGRLADWQSWISAWQASGKLRSPSGGQVPMLITEHGYCTATGECPPSVPTANRITDENVRAQYARRSYLWAKSHGVQIFSYYHVVNLPDAPSTWDTGIMDRAGRWSPSIYALHDTVLGPGPSKAAVVTPGSGSYFYRDPGTATIRARYWNIAAQAWMPTTLGGSAAGEPTAYTHGGETNVYFRGTDNAIWQWQWSNNAWHLTRLGGSAAGDPVAYRHQSGASHAVYFRGTDNAIWQIQWQADNQSWTLTSLGGSAAGNPTAYVNGTTQAVYFRGTDGAIWQLQWQLDNQSWTLTSLGGSASADPTAYVNGSTQSVYFRGTDTAIWQLQWQSDNQSWTLTRLGGSAAANARPTAYVADGTQFVYFRGTDNAIWLWQWQLDNLSWSLSSLGGSAAIDPSGYSADYYHTVFFRGTNGGIWQHFWNPQTQQWGLYSI